MSCAEGGAAPLELGFGVVHCLVHEGHVARVAAESRLGYEQSVRATRSGSAVQSTAKEFAEPNLDVACGLAQVDLRTGWWWHL